MLKELSHEIESGRALVLVDRPLQAHVSVDSQIFNGVHFLIQIIVLTACLKKTGSFARY